MNETTLYSPVTRQHVGYSLNLNPHVLFKSKLTLVLSNLQSFILSINIYPLGSDLVRTFN